MTRPRFFLVPIALVAIALSAGVAQAELIGVCADDMTQKPVLATPKLMLKGRKLGLRARCRVLGSCAGATWTSKGGGAKGVIARFEVPAIAGGGAKSVSAKVPGRIRAAGRPGLRLKLCGPGGKSGSQTVIAAA